MEISENLLGPKERPVLSAKAANAKHLLPWVAELLSEGGVEALDAEGGCKGAAYLNCCLSLMEAYTICEGQPRKNSSFSCIADGYRTCNVLRMNKGTVK